MPLLARDENLLSYISLQLSCRFECFHHDVMVSRHRMRNAFKLIMT